MLSNRSIVVTRLDPIVDPDNVSGHIHRVHGGSIFTPNLINASQVQIESNCSTVEVQADKSVYWTPQLYYRYPNGSFMAYSQKSTTVYYFMKAPTGTTIYPFPDNYNMLTGDPARRFANLSDP